MDPAIRVWATGRVKDCAGAPGGVSDRALAVQSPLSLHTLIIENVPAVYGPAERYPVHWLDI